MPILVNADMPIFSYDRHKKCLPIADMPILKKCPYADIADTDINIGTSLVIITQCQGEKTFYDKPNLILLGSWVHVQELSWHEPNTVQKLHKVLLLGR